MALRVLEVMTKDCKTCRPDDLLTAASKILWDHDCGAAPVVDEGGRAVGIVTDRDICMSAYTRGRRLDEVPVRMAMARTLFTCKPDDPIESALQVMQQKQVRRLPVVDEKGKLCGLLSLADVVRASAGNPERALAAFAAIVAPRSKHAEPKREAKPVAAPAATAVAPAAVVVPKPPVTSPTASPVAASAGNASGKTGKKR